MAFRPPGTLAAAGTCGFAYVAVVTLLSLSLGRAPTPTASLLWAYLLVLAGVVGVFGVAASALLALLEGCWRRLERPAGRLGLTFLVWAAGVFTLSVAQRETTGIGKLLSGLLYSSLALFVLIPVSGRWLRRRVDALGSCARAALGGVSVLLPALPIAVHLRFPEQYPFSHAIGAVYASAAAAVGLRLLRVPLPRARLRRRAAGRRRRRRARLRRRSLRARAQAPQHPAGARLARRSLALRARPRWRRVSSRLGPRRRRGLRRWGSRHPPARP